MTDEHEHEPASPEPAAPASVAEKPPAGGEDVVVITGRRPNGDGMGVVRFREGNVEVGAVQPLKEGKPIVGELVRLHPRRESPMVCDVEVELDARPPRERSSPGPAQVATEAYRNNWDAIWAKKTELN